MARETWPRSDIIATVSAVIALVSIIITLFTTEPHLRSMIGLDHYPRLNAQYIGTETFGNHGSFNMQLNMFSELPGGYISGHIHLNRDYTPDCGFTGSVTFQNQIRITCLFSDHQLDFNGYVYPDHIEGTAATNVSSDLYHIYQWYLVPKPGTKIL